MNLILDIPYDIYSIYTPYLSNKDILNLITNKETYIILNEYLEKRKNIYIIEKIQRFVHIWNIIKNNINNVHYIFCMINYDEEIIIEILATSVHNDIGCYRETINHSIKENSFNVYHSGTQWYNKPKKKLKERILKLVFSGYKFDNFCLISKQPNFKNRKIL